jgi:hypothetical protein
LRWSAGAADFLHLSLYLLLRKELRFRRDSDVNVQEFAVEGCR